MKNKCLRLLALLCCCVALCGCVDSTERLAVKETVKTYFQCLQENDFSLATAYVYAGDETMRMDISKTALNKKLFQNIQYELWNVSKEDDMPVAKMKITQISMGMVYAKAAVRYEAYLAENPGNRIAAEDMLEKYLLEAIDSTSETVSIVCSVPLRKEKDGSYKLKMTREFRNALFGGGLDAMEKLTP